MTHEELQELLGAYALDAVDAGEEEVVEAHLATCPRCRSELEAYRDVAAALGDQGGPARPDIWDRIAGQLTGTPPPLRLPSTRRRRPGRPRRVAVAGAVAAVAAVIIALLGWDVSRLSTRVDRLQTTTAAHGIAQAARAAAHSPDAESLDLRSASGVVSAQAVVRPDGQAYLLTTTLPALPEDQTYQLWGLSGHRVVSLGLLGRRAAPSAFRLDARITRLMITAEPAGGAVVPTKPLLAQGPVPTQS